MKKIIALMCAVALIIAGSGCSVRNKSSSKAAKEEPTLNEWQKEFLEGQGLPTEYSELNLTQRLSVEAIYEMMMYLENKYGIGFEYNGYVRPQILEQEHMYAYPKGGDKETDTFTVTREEDVTLTDDYPNIVVRPYYEQMITDYVKDYFGSDLFKVYATVSSSTMQSIVDNSENIKVKDIGASTVIFIENNVCSEEKITDFANIFGEWLNDNELYGVAQLILLKKETEVISLSRENYSDLLGKQEYVTRLRCNIQEGREIKISGGK